MNFHNNDTKTVKLPCHSEELATKNPFFFFHHTRSNPHHRRHISVLYLISSINCFNFDSIPCRSPSVYSIYLLCLIFPSNGIITKTQSFFSRFTDPNNSSQFSSLHIHFACLVILNPIFCCNESNSCVDAKNTFFGSIFSLSLTELGCNIFHTVLRTISSAQDKSLTSSYSNDNLALCKSVLYIFT